MIGIQDELARALPELELIEHEAEASAAGKFDFRARDLEGHEYFIEVKRRACHRVDIGQIIELASAVIGEFPEARVILVCSSMDEAVREILSRAGIRSLVLPDIAPTRRLMELSEPRLDMPPSQQRAYFALIRAETGVVSTKKMASMLGISWQKAKDLLAGLSGSGVIFRIGRGKYAVLPPEVLYERKSFTADPLVILDSLLEGEDYYVSYSTAAYIHGIATLVPQLVYVSTLKPRRSVDLGGSKIRYVTLKPSRFFGYEDIDYSGAALRVSDLERTVVDSVDRPDLVGGVDESARLIAEAHERLRWAKVIDYARRIEKRVLLQRLGFLLETLSDSGYDVPESTLAHLDQAIETKFAYPLDPKSAKRGELSRRWYIYRNVDPLAWEHA